MTTTSNSPRQTAVPLLAATAANAVLLLWLALGSPWLGVAVGGVALAAAVAGWCLLGLKGRGRAGAPPACLKKQRRRNPQCALISVPMPSSVNSSSSTACSSSPLMMTAVFTPEFTASSAQPILGSMPP